MSEHEKTVRDIVYAVALLAAVLVLGMFTGWVEAMGNLFGAYFAGVYEIVEAARS